MNKYLLTIKTLLPTGLAYDCEAVITLSASSVDGSTLISHVPPITVVLNNGEATVPLMDNASLGEGSYYVLRLYSVETHGTAVTRTPIGTYIFVMTARDCNITEIITVVPTQPEPLEASKAYASEAKESANVALSSVDTVKEYAKNAQEYAETAQEYAEESQTTYNSLVKTADKSLIAIGTAKSDALDSINNAETSSLEAITTQEEISTESIEQAADAGILRINTATETAITEFTVVTEAANTKIADFVAAAETAKTGAEEAKAGAEEAKSAAETAATTASGSESASALSATTAIGAMNTCTSLAETCTAMKEQCSTDAKNVAESLDYIDTHYIGQFFESLYTQALLLQKSIELSLYKFHADDAHEYLENEIDTLEAQNTELQNDVSVLELRLSEAEYTLVTTQGELKKESIKTLGMYAQLKYEAEQQRPSEKIDIFLFDLWRTASNCITSVAQSIKIFNVQGA